MSPSDPPHPRRVLHVAMEAVFCRDPSGRIWSRDIYNSEHWAIHLAVFDQVCLVARVADVAEAAPEAVGRDPARLSFVRLPAYAGLAAFSRVAIRLCRILWVESATVDFALLRLPGPIPSVLGLCLVLRGRPYAVQLVGDVDQVLAIGHFSRATQLTRLPLTWVTRYLCRTAKAIAYVTRQTLQLKYPCDPSAAQFAFANVQLDPSELSAHAHAITSASIKVAFCGSLAQFYKGLDVLIAAVRLLRDRGLRLHVSVVGDGRHRDELAQMAVDLGVADQFVFMGQLARSRVLEVMDAADLFVMPSRTEGLPRALVEAMAKGLPCIASRVGGIPELLSDEALVAPDDAAALASAIERFALTPELMNTEAMRNLAVAKQFVNPQLDLERRRFVTTLRQIPS